MTNNLVDAFAKVAICAVEKYGSNVIVYVTGGSFEDLNVPKMKDLIKAINKTEGISMSSVELYPGYGRRRKTHVPSSFKGKREHMVHLSLTDNQAGILVCDGYRGEPNVVIKGADKDVIDKAMILLQEAWDDCVA